MNEVQIKRMAERRYVPSIGPIIHHSVRAVDPVINALRTERVRRGWSQSHLSDLLGHTAGSISQWESGNQCPRWTAIRDWAEALGFRFHLTRFMVVDADEVD